MREVRGVEKVWEINEIDYEKFLRLRKKFHFPDIVIKSLLSKGIDTEEKIEEFSNPSFLSLYSPFYFKDMSKAVNRILNAIDNRELILIFGDRDVDGVTATAILYRFLERLGANVVYRVPEGSDNYGLSPEVIDWAILNEISLIITVDCGITVIEEIRKAKQFGIDIIVTDHHEPREILPEAYAIINPRVGDCGYPFDSLSGSSVALKLVLGIAERLFLRDYFDKEIVFFDIETTGLNPYKDEIIEIGAVICKNGLVIDKLEYLVKIDKPLPDNIKEFTGITDELLEKEGKPLDFVLDEFIGFIGDRKLAGHNIMEFDLKFLEYNLKKYGKKRITNPVEDTLVISRVMLKHLKDHKLSTVAKHLGIFFDEKKLHRGLTDAILSSEIYRRLIILRNQRYVELLEENLPLAATGTIADIMPLIDENRIIVKTGLKFVKRAPLGFLTLLKELKLEVEKITVRDISFNVSPVLNSPGRLGDASFSVELLVSNKVMEVEELVGDILKKNEERKAIVEDSFENIDELINKKDAESKKVIFFYSDKFPKGTIGLIANRLAGVYRIPVIIMTSENDLLIGSIRVNDNGFEVPPFLEALKEHFLQFGGHKNAGGFVARIKDLPVIEKKVYEFTQNLVLRESRGKIDFVLDDIEEININSVRYLQNVFEPVGYKNQIPILLLRGVEFLSFRGVGKGQKHLLIIGRKEGKIFNIMGWNFVDKLEGIIKEGFKYDIVVKPEINCYDGEEELRFVLYDLVLPQEFLNSMFKDLSPNIQ